MQSSGEMRRAVFGSLLLATLGLATACDTDDGGQDDEPQPVELSEFEGVWRQRGYARVIEITEEAVRYYDVTEVSCVPSGEGSFEDVEGEFDRIVGDEDHFSWYETGGYTRYDFDRTDELPDGCGEPDTSAVAAFDSLWHAFDENYAYFSERGVDWDEVRSDFQSQVKDDTTSEELMGIFQEVLTPLNDGHVWVFDTSTGAGFLGGTLGLLWEDWAAQHSGDDVGENPADPRGAFTASMQEYVLDQVLEGKGKSGPHHLLHWGWLDDDVAYLDVHAMATSEAEFTIPEAIELTDETMEQVMDDLKGARAFIVDARFNEGGMDTMGYAIAGWFSDKSRTVSKKRAWLGDEWGPYQDITITARSGAFKGPVALLTSKNTVSAAETFTIAMNELSNVTSVGTSTYGSLSDTLVRLLPNGWLFSQSNEVYESPDGEQYEVVGVPPDVEVKVDDDLDYYENLDKTLEEAIDVLSD